MVHPDSKHQRAACRALVALSVLAFLLLHCGQAMALDINVVTPDGTPVTGFKWLIEEDNTLQPTLEGPLLEPANNGQQNPTLTTAIHLSHAPVVASGFEDTATAQVTIPGGFVGKPLVVSILPYADFAQSAALAPADATSVDVVVNPEPLPTAQISVFVFNDNFPINNAPDNGEEGLQSFRILLDDTGGQVFQDVYGNPLGTEYLQNPDGTFVLVDGAPVVTQVGFGYVLTDADGEAIVKNIAPGKYGVNIVPPAGTNWIQTATIEGTPTIDAWVEANEPPVFTEGFGTGRWHVFFGMVNPESFPYHASQGGLPGGAGGVAANATAARLTGTVRFNHFGPPPDLQNYNPGPSVPGCYVGVNDALTGEGLYMAGPLPELPDVNGDDVTTFDIDGLAPGDYQLVFWDKDLLALFNIQTFTVHSGTNVVGPLGPGGALPTPQASLDIQSFRWFGAFKGNVFNDVDGDGFFDNEEDVEGLNLNEIGVNIRFRDGSMYQAQPTDNEGGYDLSAVFPFFKWLVVEVDFLRHKATGMTAIVDAGGAIPDTTDFFSPGSKAPQNPDYHLTAANADYMTDGARNPQLQPGPGETPASTTGENLTGEYFRTETGPVLTQAMHLFLSQDNRINWGKKPYVDGENGGISGVVVYNTSRTVDDPKFEGQEGHEPLIPWVQVTLYSDTDQNQVIDDMNGNGVVEADVDNYPLGWSPMSPIVHPGGSGKGPEDIDRDGDGVFDYGDAVQITYSDSFDDNLPSDCVWGDRPVPEIAGQMINPCSDAFATWNQIRPGVFDGGYAFTDYYPNGIAAGGATAIPSNSFFIVASEPPAGYVLQKEEDKNVDFGDTFVPGELAFPATCVGDPHEVPTYLGFNTVGGLGENPLPGVSPADLVEGAYAGETRRLCDKKWIEVRDKQNAAVDFNLFTRVPKAARGVGFVNNDAGAEFDKTSPVYGEKPSPRFVPISFQDWNGNEVARVYNDAYGHYNAMLPSNFTNNLPSTLGLGPQMLTVFLNHPWLTQPNGDRVLDPRYDPNYTQMGWTFMYYPGRTSYLDTPVLPLGSYVGFPDYGLDIEPASGTPKLAMVTGPNNSGPLLLNGSSTLTLTSVGNQVVPNPEHSEDPNAPDGSFNEPTTINRDFSFGATPGRVTIDGFQMEVLSWTASTITVGIPTGGLGDLQTEAGLAGQLMVTRGDTGLSTRKGVTVHITPTGNIRYVSEGQSIQNAVDIAQNGDLIMVRPGVYNEAVIVYKNILLQGFGGDSTQLFAYPEPLSELQEWHDKVQELIALGRMKDLGNQAAFTPFERPGFLVLTSDVTNANATPNNRRIDGFFITGSVAGGGVIIPDLGTYVTVSNNRIRGNQGTNGGGVTIGLKDNALTSNPNVSIMYNVITNNSGKDGGGGGVSIYENSHDYMVSNNTLAGNFATLNGGGVYHYGFSDDGLIEDNSIIFNEVFFGGPQGGNGGGIFISGQPVAAGLGSGAGDVTVNGNLIQGNIAGSGSGGGIRAEFFSGEDINDLTVDYDGYRLTVTNNIIVNNIATYQGGGISLSDVDDAVIVHNTISKNDSSATAQAAFLPNATASTPQVAGLGSEMHSTPLQTATGNSYSDPMLVNNIIFGNRSFSFDRTLNNNSGGLVFAANTDLDVSGGGAADVLHPQSCILSDATGYTPGNYETPPTTISRYNNNLLFSAIIDEGGNNISARMYPLSVAAGNYRLNADYAQQGSAVNTALYPTLANDIDGDARNADVPDIGADELGCPGDLDGDGMVGVADLRIFRMCDADPNAHPNCAQADVNGDTTIDAADFTIIQNNLGTVCAN